MQYTIENFALSLTVDTLGAEPVRLIDRNSGKEIIWNGNPDVWFRHAPILFPWTGRLPGGKICAKGECYTINGGVNGFARDVEHQFVSQDKDSLVFELKANDETLSQWPYDFVLRSILRLDGRTLHHTLEVYNPSEENLRFGIGYHPAFTVPFDDKHTTNDYEFVFEQEESPLCVSTFPTGLLNGKSYYLATNTKTIPLTDDLFDKDSHCMVNIKSKTLAIVEKDTGRQIRCNIEGFPYVVIWSAPSKPWKFVCIEPWHTITAPEDWSQEWEKRPCMISIAKGESWSTTMSTTFDL